MVSTVWSNDGMFGDWTLSVDGDLADVDPLGTAVVLCLFTDKPLPNPDSIQSLRTTWHGNSFDSEGEGELGSLLWTLVRDIPDETMILRARTYAAQALQPLVDQKLCRGYSIDVQLQKYADSADVMLAMSVTLIGLKEQSFFFKYPVF